MKLSSAWHLVKDSCIAWNDAKAQTLGASLAYYTAFSIAPLLVIILAVAGLVFGQQAANGQVAGEIAATAGPKVASALEEVLANARFSPATPWALAASAIMLLVGASGVFAELQNSLNTIWQVQMKPDAGLLQMVRDRFLSFAMVLVTCFLLFCSLVLTAMLYTLTETIHPQLLPGGAVLWQWSNFGLSLVIITVLFGLIYKVLPDAVIAWRDVWVGALVTALLFTAGKHLLSLYLTYASPASAYGAAGSLAIFLLWIYYSAQIFLFGAAFTRVYAAQRGRRIRPTEHAIEVPTPALTPR
jgi:membrane protein